MTCRVCNRPTLTHCGWHECPRPQLSFSRRQATRRNGAVAWTVAAYAAMAAVWWFGWGVWW